MVDLLENKRFGASIATLRAAGVIPGVAQAFKESAESMVGELRETILAEVRAYTQSGNPDVPPELQRHLVAIVEEACRLLAGLRPDDLSFVKAHAQRCAEQKFPLDALLHTYQCVYKCLLPWIRDAALAIASDSAHVRRVVAAVTRRT